MKIEDYILDILRASVVEDQALRLPEQLERRVYLQVDKVLKAAGGRWNSRVKAHLFDGPAFPVVAAMLDTGEIVRPQDHGFFPTPPEVAETVIDWAGIRVGDRVLEPSAGTGALAQPAAEAGGVLDCVELLPKLADKITQDGYAARVIVGDFLDLCPAPTYDRVVMNPPFANGTDVQHVLHALGFLAPGGHLVAVMAAGIEFRRDRDHHKLRLLVAARGGEIFPLPEDSFKASGTKVRTAIVSIPAADVPT